LKKRIFSAICLQLLFFAFTQSTAFCASFSWAKPGAVMECYRLVNIAYGYLGLNPLNDVKHKGQVGLRIQSVGQAIGVYNGKKESLENVILPLFNPPPQKGRPPHVDPPGPGIYVLTAKGLRYYSNPKPVWLARGWEPGAYSDLVKVGVPFDEGNKEALIKVTKADFNKETEYWTDFDPTDSPKQYRYIGGGGEVPFTPERAQVFSEVFRTKWAYIAEKFKGIQASKKYFGDWTSLRNVMSDLIASCNNESTGHFRKIFKSFELSLLKADPSLLRTVPRAKNAAGVN